MISIFRSRYLLEITCADPVYLLERLAQIGVTVQNVQPVGQLAVRLEVTGKNLHLTSDLAARQGGKVRVVRRWGPAALYRIIKRRKALACGLTLLVILTLYIPTRVLFISVEGNEQLHARQILERADQIGISFWASRKDIRSERMKNALLQAIPELKWAGINTYGCNAVISVLERETGNGQQPHTQMVQGIYACRDGIVSSVTATKGTPLCKPGQAISAGQLLISGYTDCGLVTRAEQAEGEVRAITQRNVDAVIPAYDSVRTDVVGSSTRWSVQFGKKRIKLYFDSGNSTTGCGKISESFDLTLPGGFRLPISVVKETVVHYAQAHSDEAPQQRTMTDLAEKYVSGCMVAGKILKAEASVTSGGDVYLLTGVYTCDEMIGKLQKEEIG